MQNTLDAGWDLDLATLSVAQRHAVSPAHTTVATAIRSRLIDLHLAELEVPARALHGLHSRSLALHLAHVRRVLLVVLRLGTGLCQSSALARSETGDLLFGGQDKLWMWDACVGWEEVVVEDLGGVFAGELAGLGGRPEDLLCGGLVDRQVVDRLEVGAFLVLWDNRGDGAGVWLCKTLALLIVR